MSPADRDPPPADPTDRLHVQSHVWAAETSTELTLAVIGAAPVTVAVAEPGPIIAMKLQAVMNRGATEEGTDLLDIVRLTLDTRSGPVARDQLEHAHEQLRADAFRHAQRWFSERAAQSLRKIPAVPAGRDVEIDDVQLVDDLLTGVLGPTS